MNEMTVGSNAPRPVPAIARWVLLTGNRLHVAFGVLLVIGSTFFVVGILGIATVTTPTRVMWYLNGAVNGLLTLVPIAVGVNQIVLSHEFGSIQDLYRRRSDLTEFRERVEQQTGTTVSPTHPSAFFGILLSSVSDTARTLRSEHHRPADELGRVAGTIADRADRAIDELGGGDTRMFRTVTVMLDYDTTQPFAEVRRLLKRSSDHADDTTEALRQMRELFIEIDAAQQFLKTVVVERQLAQLSRLLIYSGIPAVAVAAIGIFTYRDVAGLMLSRPLLVGVAGTLVVVPLVPLAILGSYILRVATIARRTASFGPFVPESDG